MLWPEILLQQGASVVDGPLATLLADVLPWIKP